MTAIELSWEDHRGIGDPEQRFSLWRLCPCQDCGGSGKTGPSFAISSSSVIRNRCPECRGEGKRLELVATAGTAEAAGVALITLGMEGEWDECPLGVLDGQGERGRKWLVKPWVPSPRNVSDAGRLLATQRRAK